MPHDIQSLLVYESTFSNKSKYQTVYLQIGIYIKLAPKYLDRNKLAYCPSPINYRVPLMTEVLKTSKILLNAPLIKIYIFSRLELSWALPLKFQPFPPVPPQVIDQLHSSRTIYQIVHLLASFTCHLTVQLLSLPTLYQYLVYFHLPCQITFQLLSSLLLS